MKVSTSTRLKQIMNERNLKQVDILRMSLPLQKELGIKMGKSTFSQYVNGIQSPDQHRIYLLSKTLDVNEPWLMGFDVDKKRIPDNERGITEDKQEHSNDIIHVYNKLDLPRQEIVYTTAIQLLEEQNNKIAPSPSNNNDLDLYSERKAKKQILKEIDLLGYLSAGAGEFLMEEHKEKILLPENIIPHSADFCLIVNGDSMEPVILDGSYVFIDETHEIASGTISAVMVNGESFIKRVWFENDHARLESFNDNYEDIIVTKEEDFHIIGKVVI